MPHLTPHLRRDRLGRESETAARWCAACRPVDRRVTTRRSVHCATARRATVVVDGGGGGERGRRAAGGPVHAVRSVAWRGAARRGAARRGALQLELDALRLRRRPRSTQILLLHPRHHPRPRCLRRRHAPRILDRPRLLRRDLDHLEARSLLGLVLMPLQLRLHDLAPGGGGGGGGEVEGWAGGNGMKHAKGVEALSAGAPCSDARVATEQCERRGRHQRCPAEEQAEVGEERVVGTERAPGGEEQRLR